MSWGGDGDVPPGVTGRLYQSNPAGRQYNGILGPKPLGGRAQPRPVRCLLMERDSARDAAARARWETVVTADSRQPSDDQGPLNRVIADYLREAQAAGRPDRQEYL